MEKNAAKKAPAKKKTAKGKDSTKAKAVLVSERPAWLGKVRLSGVKINDLDADELRLLKLLLHGVHRHVAAVAYKASLQRYGTASDENVKDAATDVEQTLRPDVKSFLY